MKFKKIAAVLTAVTISTGTMSVSAFADSKREYNCEWVDVRNTSNYELTVEKSVVDGKEIATIRLIGLSYLMPTVKLSATAEETNNEFTREVEYYATTIDIGSGGFLFFTYDMGTLFGEEDKTKCTVASPFSPKGPINGKYCLYDDFHYGMQYVENVYYKYSGPGIEFGKSKLFRSNDDKITLECTVDYSDSIVADLLNLKETTVATFAKCRTLTVSDGNGDTASSGWGYIGFTSNGSGPNGWDIIKGDGKYIDCATGEEKTNDNYDASLPVTQALDNLTDLPKEIVKITVKDSASETTTAAEITTAAEVTTTTKVTTATESESPVPSQTLTDKKTNITITGSIPENTALKVEEKKTEDNSYTYDISIVDSKGNKVQPNGKVEVKLPIPEAFKDQNCYVYRIETGGSYTDMNAKAENGNLIFTTDHFSEYVISNTQLSSENTENKNQTTGVVLTLIPAAIAAAGIVISKKRK